MTLAASTLPVYWKWENFPPSRKRGARNVSTLCISFESGLRLALMTATRKIGRICVLCGTNPGARPEYGQAARHLGKVLADEQIELVYGGASVGLMGELADAVQEHGGQVTGVTLQRLIEKEVAHRGIGNLIVVASMHQRKAQMSDLAHGFIGVHTQPCGLLNVAGYFDALIGWLDHGVREGFVTEQHRNMVLVDDDPGRLVTRMQQYEAPEGERLLERANR
jgi:predicted Rossmann-fold nucleotide-binding protein